MRALVVALIVAATPATAECTLKLAPRRLERSTSGYRSGTCIEGTARRVSSRALRATTLASVPRVRHSAS